MAAGLDRAVTAGENTSAYFNVYNQPNREALAAALNQLTGEVHAASNRMTLDASNQFLGLMLNPHVQGRRSIGLGTATASGFDSLHALAPAGLPRIAMWGSVFGQASRLSSDATNTGAARQRGSDGHIAAGMDVGLTPGLVAGVALSAGESRVSLSGGQGSARGSAYQAGAYVLGETGALSFGASGAYSSLDVDSDRSIPVLGLPSVKGSYRMEAWSGRVQADYALTRLFGVTIAPTVAFQAQSVRTPRFVERNGLTDLPVGLVSAGTTNASTRSEFGVKLSHSGAIGTMPVSVNAGVAWGYYHSRGNAFDASLAGLSASRFRINGPRDDRNVALFSIGGQIDLSQRATLSGSFDSQVSSRSQAFAGGAKLRVAF